MSENNLSEILNEGEFSLTPIQSIFLNKCFPKGYKLELEENIIKSVDLNIFPAVKKQKTTVNNDYKVTKKRKNNEDLFSSNGDSDALGEQKKKRSSREKKPNIIEDIGYIDKTNPRQPKTSFTLELHKKCEKLLLKVKKHPNADVIINSNYQSENIPTFQKIEKSLKNHLFTNVSQLGNEFRSLFNYYFSTFANGNAVLYQKLYNLSNFFEENFKDIENEDEEKGEIQELHKKVAKLTKEVKDIHGKGVSTNPFAGKKNDKNFSNIMEKPMTIQEKNSLGMNIRLLNPDQLRGIISILSDSNAVEQNTRYFEFDIENLPTKKLRELEKYVKNSNQTSTTANKVKNPNKPLSEKEQIAQLKTDLAISEKKKKDRGSVHSNSQKMGDNLNPNSNNTKDSNFDNSNSISSSDSSDSESLSSLDIKKNKKI